MKIICTFLLLCLFPFHANAGDCYSHPVFIHKFQINSCEVISEGNAARISKGALPKIVADRFPGLIITGKHKAIRKIDLEERDIKFQAHPWQKSEEASTFLYQGKGPSECSGFGPGNVVKFYSYTNCECDTGPAPDGYCALTVGQIGAIPEEYLKYAE